MGAYARVRVEEDPEPLEIALRTSLLSADLVLPGRERVDVVGAVLRLDGMTPAPVPGRVVRQATSSASGVVAVERLPHGSYDLWVLHADHGFEHRPDFEVGGAQGTSGMSIRLRPPLRCAGRVDEAKLGVEVPRTSEVVLVREPDEFGIAQTRVGVVDAQGGFVVEGLLPGSYAVEIRCAVRVAARGGGWLLLPPSQTSVRVNCPPMTIGETDRSGVVLDRRR